MKYEEPTIEIIGLDLKQIYTFNVEGSTEDPDGDKGWEWPT